MEIPTDYFSASRKLIAGYQEPTAGEDRAMAQLGQGDNDRITGLIGERQRGNSILLAAAVYFGMVFGAGFLLGAVRVPFLVPRLGERIAELAEMPLMFAAIYFAAGYLVRRYGASIASFGWVLVGAMSLTMLVAAELLLAIAIAGRSLGEYLASRDPISGSVYLGMLLVFAAMPWLRRKVGAIHADP